MFIGFDYGTANCSVALMQNGTPRLLPLENNSPYLSSMLCAPTREAVSEWLWRHHQVGAQGENAQLLRRAISYNLPLTPTAYTLDKRRWRVIWMTRKKCGS